MTMKKSGYVVLACFLAFVVLTTTISSSEAGRSKKRSKGKFVTQGGSKCRWIEKGHRGGQSYSLLVSCKCKDKQGDKSFYSYQCEYSNMEVNNATEPLNETRSEFFNKVAQAVADGDHACDLESIDIPSTSSNVTMTLGGNKTPDRCQAPPEDKRLSKFIEKFEKKMMKRFENFQRRMNTLFGSARSIWDDFGLF